ncbi:branched-chain amino acid ABC transporter permease [Moorella sulfitireducens]|uniref:branched-chain amino acid ABC transporter permease n=1 Tax=Neomoorella sulfitireducens TaxID=2972948 RepID=UPI0021AC0517|nr:branched-chain amino acid ABC transporter permease [Moorella sulfitireducens]
MVQDFAQPILNGILLGGLYAVVGIGMAMIFGIMRITNLAHGDLMVLASYLSLVIISGLGINPFVTLVIAIPVMFFVGLIVQSALINRVLKKGNEPPLLVTFGLSIIIQNALLLIFTPDAKMLMNSLSTKSIFLTNYLSVPVIYLVDFIIAVALILVFNQFYQKTYLGRAIRAASDDEGAAELVGINTRRIYGIAMGIAMVTAAIAGVLVGMTFTFYPFTGTQYLIIAFGVIVIGGLNSLLGVLVGGVILGLAQLIGAEFVGTGYQLLVGYIILLLVLVVRPQGIFAKN